MEIITGFLDWSYDYKCSVYNEDKNIKLIGLVIENQTKELGRDAVIKC